MSKEKAERLRALHQRDDLLVVPNAFDVGSARIIENAGFPTVASSSSALASTIGAQDGEGAPWEDVITGLGKLAAGVDIPVSADFEGGYVSSTGGIENSVRALAEAGVAGAGLEDSTFGEDATGVVAAEQHAEVIAAARATAEELDYPLWINGRTEVVLRQVGDEDTRLEEATRRLKLYVEAGADGVFCPGLRDPDAIQQLASSVDAPLNVLWVPSMPSLKELERLGARRVTFGGQLYLAALAGVERVVAGLAEHDTGPLEEIGYPSPEVLRRIRGL
jgi:2-methylisocitrate lyase-like PEP mutase family enzyme